MGAHTMQHPRHSHSVTNIVDRRYYVSDGQILLKEDGGIRVKAETEVRIRGGLLRQAGRYLRLIELPQASTLFIPIVSDCAGGSTGATRRHMMMSSCIAALVL
jgi:hypothetical protein